MRNPIRLLLIFCFAIVNTNCSHITANSSKPPLALSTPLEIPVTHDGPFAVVGLETTEARLNKDHPKKRQLEEETSDGNPREWSVSKNTKNGHKRQSYVSHDYADENEEESDDYKPRKNLGNHSSHDENSSTANSRSYVHKVVIETENERIHAKEKRAFTNKRRPNAGSSSLSASAKNEKSDKNENRKLLTGKKKATTNLEASNRNLEGEDRFLEGAERSLEGRDKSPIK